MRYPANVRYNKQAAIIQSATTENPRYSTHLMSCCIIYAKI